MQDSFEDNDLNPVGWANENDDNWNDDDYGDSSLVYYDPNYEGEIHSDDM